MKRTLLASAFVIAAGTAQAEIGAFVGITYAFGSNQGMGFTVQATSSRKQDKAIVAAGVSFYPLAAGEKIGFPVGLGYQWKNGVAVIGYDLLIKKPVVSGGITDTRRRTQTPAGEGGNGLEQVEDGPSEGGIMPPV
ncbi:MAG TPA: hypothetical protein PKC60_14410 [Hydrogenophaga sp.]|uniref:hypothetical protein n=1 Tax=Hydrogenophaga sp. TaxID=1904254 RepID=UPI002B9DF932|nr:hypothetical protein [Hydrogenophaga sp.]HMN94420.1 hypothetical protein [Hydrogenophaga sp.]